MLEVVNACRSATLSEDSKAKIRDLGGFVSSAISVSRTSSDDVKMADSTEAFDCVAAMCDIIESTPELKTIEGTIFRRFAASCLTMKLEVGKSVSPAEDTSVREAAGLGRAALVSAREFENMVTAPADIADLGHFNRVKDYYRLGWPANVCS